MSTYYDFQFNEKAYRIPAEVSTTPGGFTYVSSYCDCSVCLLSKMLEEFEPKRGSSSKYSTCAAILKSVLGRGNLAEQLKDEKAVRARFASYFLSRI